MVFCAICSKIPSLRPWLRQRHALEFQTDLFAEAAHALPGSPVSEWLKLPPAIDLGARLSASALQTYEICPLQFKLEREWRIPGEVPAAMEYGAIIHRILLAYYESVRLGRTIDDDQLIELFKTDLGTRALKNNISRNSTSVRESSSCASFWPAANELPCPRCSTPKNGSK